jgi:hypothetical protein
MVDEADVAAFSILGRISARKDFVFTFLRPHSASTKLRAPTRIFRGGSQNHLLAATQPRTKA